MAADEVLLHRAAHQGLCSLRFYGWSEPTLSLGYFQAIGDRARHPASQACPVVRRPTGGGAIVHDRELTYAVAVPDGVAWARHRDGLYRRIHEALIEALSEWGIRASLNGPGQPQADDGTAFLCFQRRAPGDVVVGQHKLAGSAQRRLRGAVLQHGSVLLGQSPAAPELLGLKEWAGQPIAADTLAQAWLSALRRALDLEFYQSPLSRDEEDRVRHLAVQKYSSPLWTARR